MSEFDFENGASRSNFMGGHEDKAEWRVASDGDSSCSLHGKLSRDERGWHCPECLLVTSAAADVAAGRIKALAPADAPRWTARDVENLGKYVEWHGPIHDDDCPGDDTCECSWQPILASVNRLCLAAAPSGGARLESAWQDMATAKQDGRAIIGQTWDGIVHPVFWSPAENGWKWCGDGWHSGVAPRLIGWQPFPPPTPTPQPKGAKR